VAIVFLTKLIGANQMKNTLLSKLLIIFAVAILSACGGGGSSSSSSTAPTYGAIYVNTQLASGMVWNYSTPALAAENAKAKCVQFSSSTFAAATCVLVLEFGENMCGALYRSANTATTGTYGAASASSAAVAESNALAACRTRGGTNCQFGYSACNGSGTPSSNSTAAGINIKDSSVGEIELPELLQTQ